MRLLELFLTQHPAQKIAVAFHDLSTHHEFLFAADESFHPASTIKVAIMMEAFHQATLGSLALDDRIAVINSFPSLANGSAFSTLLNDDAETTLYGKIGEMESLHELIRLMIVRSSNLAANLLIQVLGAVSVTAYLGELGIGNVILRRGLEDKKAFALGINNTATARGLMQMMKLIAEGKAVSPGASREMEQILLAQEFNEGIPAGLPTGVRVAHKSGWIEGLYHDFGIVLPEVQKPYVLAVMTEGFTLEEQAHAATAAISRMIFEAVRGDAGRSNH